MPLDIADYAARSGRMITESGAEVNVVSESGSINTTLTGSKPKLVNEVLNYQIAAGASIYVMSNIEPSYNKISVGVKAETGTTGFVIRIVQKTKNKGNNIAIFNISNQDTTISNAFGKTGRVDLDAELIDVRITNSDTVPRYFDAHLMGGF